MSDEIFIEILQDRVEELEKKFRIQETAVTANTLLNRVFIGRKLDDKQLDSEILYLINYVDNGKPQFNP